MDIIKVAAATITIGVIFGLGWLCGRASGVHVHVSDAGPIEEAPTKAARR